MIEDKLDKMETQSNSNTEKLCDMEERISNMEKKRKLDDLKIAEIETELDENQAKSIENTTINKLAKEIVILKEVNISTNKQLQALQSVQSDSINKSQQKVTQQSETYLEKYRQ